MSIARLVSSARGMRLEPIIRIPTLTTAVWRRFAVHVFEGMEHRPYFEGVERIMDDYEGRPHWGKLHFQDAATLSTRYPQWSAFTAVRDRVDPERRFTNAYLERVLGA